MLNPHPFYRFKQGWNAGFYPDNQIVSDLLNELHSLISSQLPGWYTLGVTTVGQLNNQVKALVNTYNAYPYFGNFNVTLQLQYSSSIDYLITIMDESLFKTDATQYLTIYGEFDDISTKVLTISPVLSSFTPGSYSGSFDDVLVTEELKAKEALRVVDLNGSAVFPITYKYNSTTNAAISGLARAKDLQLVNGEINRLPAATLPYQNQRTFELPQLNGDDLYIISIIERIIEASFIDSASIITTYNSFVNSLPDGWGSSYTQPSYTTYERLQFVYSDITRRKFILIGRRYGSTWLWQRFVSDDVVNPTYNFLSAYTETTALPYEPNQAGRWLYNDNTYDFEFVEFTSGCYQSQEFYAMPAKPGDQWQFNVANANLEGIDNALVGLFTESGQLIQQIGTVALPLQNYTGLGMYYISRGSFSDWYDENYLPEQDMPFQFIDCDGNLIGDPLVTVPAGAITSNDFNDFKNLIEGLAWPDYMSVIVTQNENGTVDFNFTFTSLPECICGVTAYQTVEDTEILYIRNSSYSQLATPTQHQASVTIPSKKGCYRMGIYNEPNDEPIVTTCELTFNQVLVNPVAQINIMNENYEGQFLTFAIYDGSNYSQVYQCPTPFPIDPGNLISTIIDFANTIPGMTATWDGETNMEFTWNVTVDCGANYSMHAGVTSDEDFWSYYWFSTENQPCVCPESEGTSYELYSLSNIINIDASDCYSTMIEFWQDSDSIAESFEYFNNWKQRVRIGLNGGGEKPVFEESLYRQSNGVTRRPQNKQDLSLDLHTDFFDLETQLAMTDATRHPYLIWEGKSIFVRGDIEVATTQDFTTQSSFETLSQMKFQALIQGFQPRNSSCLTC